MIELYYAATPNGHKVRIFLEEAGLAYRIVPVNLSKGEQSRPEFVAIAPNSRVPAIIDHSPAMRDLPLSIFESGAILLYLAEKTEMFMPEEPGRRLDVLQWLFWQMAGLGPMAGQIGHFNIYANEKVPYGCILRRLRQRSFVMQHMADDRKGDVDIEGEAFAFGALETFDPRPCHARQWDFEQSPFAERSA